MKINFWYSVNNIIKILAIITVFTGLIYPYGFYQVIPALVVLYINRRVRIYLEKNYKEELSHRKEILKG